MDKYIAMIPARGGSKSIKLKNIHPIAGRPLVYWSIDAALGAKKVDKVYVSTDSSEIRRVVEAYDRPGKERLFVVERSEWAATDTATTEDAMIDFSDKIEYENMVFIQCTNPLLSAQDVDACIDKHPNFDSILSTVVQKRFYWRLHEDGSITEIEHDIRKRPRRQDWDGVLAENGCIYVISKENLYKGHCRLYGKVGTHIMSDDSYYEIDEPIDWIIIEQLLKHRHNIK